MDKLRTVAGLLIGVYMASLSQTHAVTVTTVTNKKLCPLIYKTKIKYVYRKGSYRKRYRYRPYIAYPTYAAGAYAYAHPVPAYPYVHPVATYPYVHPASYTYSAPVGPYPYVRPMTTYAYPRPIAAYHPYAYHAAALHPTYNVYHPYRYYNEFNTYGASAPYGSYYPANFHSLYGAQSYGYNPYYPY